MNDVTDALIVDGCTMGDIVGWVIAFTIQLFASNEVCALFILQTELFTFVTNCSTLRRTSLTSRLSSSAKLLKFRVCLSKCCCSKSVWQHELSARRSTISRTMSIWPINEVDSRALELDVWIVLSLQPSDVMWLRRMPWNRPSAVKPY